MELEAVGIPTVTIASDVFSTLGLSVADRLGMPGLPFVVVEHPVAHRTAADVELLADQVLPGIVRALTSNARVDEGVADD